MYQLRQIILKTHKLTPGFQKSSANITVEAAVRVKPVCEGLLDHMIVEPHPLTCISSGDGEHCSDILFIMLKLITQRLPNSGRCSPINSNVLMFLYSKMKTKSQHS